MPFDSPIFQGPPEGSRAGLVGGGTYLPRSFQQETPNKGDFFFFGGIFFFAVRFYLTNQSGGGMTNRLPWFSSPIVSAEACSSINKTRTRVGEGAATWSATGRAAPCSQQDQDPGLRRRGGRAAGDADPRGSRRCLMGLDPPPPAPLWQLEGTGGGGRPGCHGCHRWGTGVAGTPSGCRSGAASPWPTLLAWRTAGRRLCKAAGWPRGVAALPRWEASGKGVRGGGGWNTLAQAGGLRGAAPALQTRPHPAGDAPAPGPCGAPAAGLHRAGDPGRRGGAPAGHPGRRRPRRGDGRPRPTPRRGDRPPPLVVPLWKVSGLFLNRREPLFSRQNNAKRPKVPPPCQEFGGWW